MKILSKPSFSAFSLTNPEPGTIIALLIFLATFLFLTISATILKSSILELVHEPINILSNFIELTFCFSFNPMYENAFFKSCLLEENFSSFKSGKFSSIPTAISGEVPQVIIGLDLSTSIFSVLSYTESISDLKFFQYLFASIKSFPFGAYGLFST